MTTLKTCGGKLRYLIIDFCEDWLIFSNEKFPKEETIQYYFFNLGGSS